MVRGENKSPLTIRVHPDDNVEIAVPDSGIAAGMVLSDSLRAVEDIPQGHKIALKDFNPGDAVIRFGETIGYANQFIPGGSRITEGRIDLPEMPDLDDLKPATKVPPPIPPLEGYTFLGYRNPDGTAGTRNLLGITATVQCVEGVLNAAVKKIIKELLPLYPNVDGVVPVNHSYGCGTAMDTPDSAIPLRTLRNLALHPNFGGELLVIGLGCETLLPDRLIPDLPEENVVMLQKQKGFEMMIDQILLKAKQKLERLDKKRRSPCPVSDLIIGLQCGGSDSFSGVTANPAVGYAADLFVRAGATVLFSEVTEVRDGIHLLIPRTVNEEVGRKLIREMEWYDRYLHIHGSDRNANPSPGNKEGGLTNIVEKTLGSIVKSGTSSITDVLSPGEKAVKKGLIFAATPSNDFVCGTCQLASGMTIQIFTTGRGSPYGLKMAPVLKVSSRHELKTCWPDLIDVDAGRIASGEASIARIGQEIFDLVLEAAGGIKKVRADHWEIENAVCLFNPAPLT